MSSLFRAFSFAKERMPYFDNFLGDIPSLLKHDHHCLLRWVQNEYPQLLDFFLIAYWSQAEISSLIRLLHPFLAAHAEHFSYDTNSASVCFLLTITAIANNLGPYFINSHWACWMIQDVYCQVLVFDELDRLFTPHDQLLGDKLLSLPEYDTVPDCLVEPIVLGEFVACGLNAIQLNPETLPLHINAVFESVGLLIVLQLPGTLIPF
ncbi:hypothetical protein IW262DRAFT_1451053 [Armillaria fumosa]|nr:hypothetical protein IW262DRAFT_1451053 [Armillaria fumosa]